MNHAQFTSSIYFLIKIDFLNQAIGANQYKQRKILLCWAELNLALNVSSGAVFAYVYMYMNTAHEHTIHLKDFVFSRFFETSRLWGRISPDDLNISRSSLQRLTCRPYLLKVK